MLLDIVLRKAIEVYLKVTISRILALLGIKK